MVFVGKKKKKENQPQGKDKVYIIEVKRQF